MKEKTLKITVIIPVWNALSFARHQIAALSEQTRQPDRIIVVDSESDDGSPSLFSCAGYEVVTVSGRSFDHGGTRNLGLQMSSDADIVIYMTQDAIPSGSESLENLIRPFGDPTVGITYGRQVARTDAGAIERHARLFNYPEESIVRTLESVAGLGIKAMFNSNSFAAYRRVALTAIGGFPARTIMGEDQIAAAKMLLAGQSVAYVSNARVVHSHNYSLFEEFRRYFDIGVFHEQNHTLLKHFGSAISEGRRYSLSQMTYLLERAPGRIPEALLRTVLKLVGYRLGRNESTLPKALRTRLAMQSNFFRKVHVAGVSKRTNTRVATNE